MNLPKFGVQDAEDLMIRVGSVLGPILNREGANVHGCGARIGVDGIPEIFVASLTPFSPQGPELIDGVRIVYTIRPTAYLC